MTRLSVRYATFFKTDKGVVDLTGSVMKFQRLCKESKMATRLGRFFDLSKAYE
jgi:hypothetical protein